MCYGESEQSLKQKSSFRRPCGYAGIRDASEAICFKTFNRYGKLEGSIPLHSIALRRSSGRLTCEKAEELGGSLLQFVDPILKVNTIAH